MSATSADVARRAGVSRATVSQVLNGHEDRFAAETAEKVKAAAASWSISRPQPAGPCAAAPATWSSPCCPNTTSAAICRTSSSR